MNILAMDTAQGACSAAVWSEGQILAHGFECMNKGHAERLLPQILVVLEQSGLEMTGLDRLACTIGPGTFTGTRVALSAARGMALALKIPLIGVTSLEAVAAGIEPGPSKVRVTAFDARREEVYLQIFEGEALVSLTEPQVLGLDTAALTTQKAAKGRAIEIAGTGTNLLAEALERLGLVAHCPDVEGHPDARLVAQIAATRKAPARPPSPLYLRAPDAKIPEPK